MPPSNDACGVPCAPSIAQPHRAMGGKARMRKAGCAGLDFETWESNDLYEVACHRDAVSIVDCLSSSGTATGLRPHASGTFAICFRKTRLPGQPGRSVDQ